MSTKVQGKTSMQRKVEEYAAMVRAQIKVLSQKVDDLAADRSPSYTTTGELTRISEALADVAGYNKCEARRAYDRGEI